MRLIHRSADTSALQQFGAGCPLALEAENTLDLKALGEGRVVRSVLSSI